MANLENILNRDLTFLKNDHIVKAMVFPVVMYGWRPASPRAPVAAEKDRPDPPWAGPPRWAPDSQILANTLLTMLLQDN